jgi:hypothetical protein
MPLIRSSTNDALHENIREMVKAGHPGDQAAAAAYRIQREAKRGGGGRTARMPKPKKVRF